MQAVVAQADLYAAAVAPIVSWIVEKERIRTLDGISPSADRAPHQDAPRGPVACDLS